MTAEGAPHMHRLHREHQTLEKMIALYCRDHHKPAQGLCSGCTALRDYAAARLERCRFGADKPKCSACPVHCYKPAMREAIRDVMRYSGPRMLIRHPVLALGHTLDGVLNRPKELARKSS